MNIVDYLTTPGNFVTAPSGDVGCIRAFNSTTNEVEVTFRPDAGIDVRFGKYANEQYLSDMREKGIFRSYHFTKLRRGEQP